MADMINRLAETLAARSSRRGFIKTLGKITAVAAALAAGAFITAKPALADILECCTGHACDTQSCPSGTQVSYQWVCCNRVGGGFDEYFCNDCEDSVPQIICVYATFWRHSSTCTQS